MHILMLAAEDAADEILESSIEGAPVIRWRKLESYLVLSDLLEWMQELPFVGALAKKFMHEQLTLGVDIANGFRQACEKSSDALHDAFDLKHHKLSSMVQRAHASGLEHPKNLSNHHPTRRRWRGGVHRVLARLEHHRGPQLGPIPPKIAA